VFAKEGRFVARHPGLLAGCLAIVLGGLTAAASGYSPTYNTLSELPASTASQVAYNTLASAFPAGSLSPTQVYTTSSKPLAQSDLQTLSTNLSKAKGVAQVAPPTLSSDNKAALTTVILKDDPYSNQALDNVKGPVRNAAHSSAPADQVLVGGQTSTFVDIRAQLRADTKLVFPVAVGIILVILAILLQALVAPLNLLVGVALAFGATLGASVIVFLDLLGFDGIDFSLPMTLYLFVVAIGTDYNILMASRLREEFMNGYSATDATRIAITNDAPTVAAAGIILALTFGSLMLAGLDNLTELGFGVLTGILIAGFVMAPVMIPALSTLEGRLFWWPRHARPPAVPRTSEPEPEPATAAQTA